MKVARVALDVPLPTLFDYALTAAHAAPSALIGRRVAVPFGRRLQIGIVLEAGGAPTIDASRIRALARVFEAEPPLPADVLDLLKFAADYYHHPIGQVVLGALPQRLRQAQTRDSEAREALRLTPAGQAFDLGSLSARAVGQRAILSRLRDLPNVEAAELRGLSASAPRAVRALQRQGLIERVVLQPSGDAAAPDKDANVVRPTQGPPLTPHQREAVAAVLSGLHDFTPCLLRGVTGSGKTEVYLQIVAETLRRGRQALVLVPEINLTPQLVDRFRARFPGVVLAALHSNLAEGERLRAWRTAQRGEARVVIGTRLAVYTPLPQLGCIVVDEEHDASFKQQEGLRYSARDLALLRGKLRQVPVLLGSATPSLESYANALAGRYRLLELPARPGATLPAIRCVDTRKARLRHGLSGTLIEALGQRLARGEQSLVFLNRRGYAPALICPACAWVCPCPRCAARLVLHLKAQRLRCHYCGHEEPIAALCPSCGNQDLMPAGHGTQRLEQALAEALPDARILRVDRDSTRARHAFEAMQEQVRANEVDVLVGTQMLAKGHDFPRLTLVGIVNADAALYSSDFRAAERLYAQLTQVAGRAGRGDLPGEVLIQTDFPTHTLYEAVCRQDYAGFARAALAERQEAGFPPYAHQVLLRAEAGRREAVDDYLGRAAQDGAALGLDVVIYDPVPPAVERIAGRERGQLLVQAASRAVLQRFLHAWHPCLEARASRAVRWSLDVDPLEI